MRIVGNGRHFHKVEHASWYGDIAYCKWYKFNQGNDLLQTIERLAIYGMKQPVHNDKDTDQSAIELLYKNLK